MFFEDTMSGPGLLDIDFYMEELASIPSIEKAVSRHFRFLNWITRVAMAANCAPPILVGCGAVEIYTDARTATGDVDLVTSDRAVLSSILLNMGFQRSSDQRYCHHPAHSLLFEFASDSLRPGEETVTVKLDGVECLVISPEDLIVDRLETFEASGGGTDLVYAYLIYHLHHGKLNLERLRERVRRVDVRESYRFIRRLHEFTEVNGLSVDEQGAQITAECRRRRGLKWPTGLS
jgi:hypothetical protein